MDLKNTPITNVCSVQHTGTWFVIEFLKNHPIQPHFVEVKDLLNQSKDIAHDRNNILHTHIAPFDIGIHPNDKRKHLRVILVNALINTWPTVIPLRDPLLSVITRESRHPELKHSYIVHSFSYLANIQNHPNVIFVPVDIPLSKNARLDLLNRVLEHAHFPLNNEYTASYARQWDVQNTNIANPTNKTLKSMYFNRNIAALEKALPAEVQLLKNLQPVIRPFLETHGYVNLPWWD